MKVDSKPEDASQDAELAAARNELARANMQRDFAFRLLIRQHSLKTNRIQSEAIAQYWRRNGIIVRGLDHIPKDFKSKIPRWLKQLIKDVLFFIIRYV
jgi:hypothetical protein